MSADSVSLLPNVTTLPYCRVPFPTLFKSLSEAAHLEGFRDRGSVRVAVFSEFRDRVDMRRDPEEATRVVRDDDATQTIRIDAADIGRFRPANATIRGGFVELQRGGRFESGAVLPDAYVFSVSAEYQGKFGAYWYGIRDPESFGDVLHRALKLQDPLVTLWRLARVTYRDATTLRSQADVTNAINNRFDINAERPDDYFRKPLEHASEEEYRFVFLTGKEQPDPLIFECPDLLAFCEIPI